ncbi:hypothetical protein SASPL_131974 [Salvia splendens]|uniref:Kynurenine formamidase n=1 Tax=Salvia splendens TaxID=180675 RepID=A0A8X8XC38_SALSN|nr:hypothetical protein SASPL_131974 [Salvia splendens]
MRILVICILTLAVSSSSTNSNDVPVRRDDYEGGVIHDITHSFTPNTPVGIYPNGLGKFLTLLRSMKNGSDFNFSELKLPVLTSTRLAISTRTTSNKALMLIPLTSEYSMVSIHQFALYEQFRNSSLTEEVCSPYFCALISSPALLVDVPRDKNITAEVMKSLNIPKGVRRVLFRTLNTDRRLMYKKEYDSSYVGFTGDGAQWLVDNTAIKLVGLDYLSVAATDYLTAAHRVFLLSKEIILVEGLKLDDVEAGLYTVHCLPLRLVGAEGSPIRCVLMKG